MAIISDCLHILGILFFMKHVCLCALGPRFFSYSPSLSSMPAALLFLSAAIPFLYPSSLNADTNDGALRLCWHRSLAIDEQMVSELVGVDHTRRVWRGTVVGQLLDSMPCLATVMSQINRCDDIFPSPSFLRSLCRSTCFQSPGLLEYCFLYASYRLCDSAGRPGM